MSQCKQDMLDAGATLVPRTCPVHGLSPCRPIAPAEPHARPKKIYLAARFSDRPHMEIIGDRLKIAGFEITARWVYGGEDGLTRAQIANLDIDDVAACDTLVSFTQPYGTLTKGGGRHVEFGYAMARGKRLVLIGDRENVFHHSPKVEIYPTFEAWLHHLNVVELTT